MSSKQTGSLAPVIPISSATASESGTASQVVQEPARSQPPVVNVRAASLADILGLSHVTLDPVAKFETYVANMSEAQKRTMEEPAEQLTAFLNSLCPANRRLWHEALQRKNLTELPKVLQDYRRKLSTQEAAARNSQTPFAASGGKMSLIGA